MIYTDTNEVIDRPDPNTGRNWPATQFKFPLRRFTDRPQSPGFAKAGAPALALDNIEAVIAMFGRIGFGYLVLDAHMRVSKWNEPARLALEVETGPGDQAKAISSAFRQLVSSIACKFSPGTISWVVIPYKGAKPMIVYEDAVKSGENISIVMLLTREIGTHPNPARLQQMFGLTCAEVQLAVSLASGQTPLEIARQSKVSRTTIRSHLAALFSKTETNRQSELVALLNHISVLP